MIKDDLDNVFILNTIPGTRRKLYKLDKFRFRKDISKKWFTHNVVDE